jgi:hypothetical protein
MDLAGFSLAHRNPLVFACAAPTFRFPRHFLLLFDIKVNASEEIDIIQINRFVLDRTQI